MEQETKRSGWKIWLYLTPVYILLAIPLVRWTIKVDSGDVNISKDEENIFSSPEGEIKTSAAVYTPELADTGFSLNYRSSHGPDAKPLERKNTAGYRQPAPRNAAQEQAQRASGAMKGYLTYAVGKTINNPKAVSAIFNNPFVVEGFMSRDTVKAALGSTQGLRSCLLNTSVVSNFLKTSVVKAALADPQILNAVAASSLVSAMLNSTAVRDLMKDPDSMDGILASNPQITRLLKEPNVKNALTNTPQTAGVARKLRLDAANN
ncbi:MAG: hypothetical protein A2X34_08580 [Elusimicrobia bacterium GWC2_51_8]|nr:MAG: hypothetical protein A2X33_07925 [Elusimicrobia bacterium GWA2_51_34]OGR58112.1 MAG: hypothetical protein A2X34_08580 [Elusimicrobia bacterium GWC2_51_8]HAF95123.1 hypothetical protein [Elusimicrobiota bacterium]HCE98600.1 hypothetical protein [Elusimicrobiota bacterium]